MAKRRQKTRTHKNLTTEEVNKIPKSMVLTLGSSLKNHSLTQLVKDFRQIMQPHTAAKLRERRENRLRDFVTMAGPLGVTDLFVFKQSERTGGVSLRISKMPKGPVLHFKVNQYSLSKDVRNILRHPKSLGRGSQEFLNSPLLVMNGFLNKYNEAENHEKLMITVFQNMFPAINPQQTKVSSIRRVLIINKNPEDQSIEIRHYAIDTKVVEGNRNVRKLVNKSLHDKMPNMSRLEDASDFLLDPYSVGGLTSDSEAEENDIVEIKKGETNIKKMGDQEEEKEASQPTKKRALKLTELGPRINMSLIKIEESLTEPSKVLYHSSITKSQAEVKNLNRKHEQKRQAKEARKSIQKKHVDAKNEKKQEKLERRRQRKEAKTTDNNGGQDDDIKDLEESKSSDNAFSEDESDDQSSELFSDGNESNQE